MVGDRMGDSEGLAAVLLDALERSATTADGGDLEGALQSMVSRAQAAWPSIRVAPRQFVRYVAARAPRDLDVPSGLSSLHAEGLYIACACAFGDAGAMTALEEAFFGDIDAKLARMSPDPGFAEEVKQRVRAKLFVQDVERPARIASYAGRGDLRTFLRVLMTREAISLRRHRRGRREVPLADERPVERWETTDPELLHLRRSYEAEFEEAFREAIAALSSEERNLLRYYYVDRLNIDHIGAIYGIHRVSASRRLNKARLALVERTREHLAERLDLGSTDLRSVLRLIQSAVDVSLRRALGDASRG
jgi:RNA polymerase sigma-70 factor (ECF subfamily)